MVGIKGKAGRKPFYADGRMHRIMIRLPGSLQTAILRSCVRRGMHMSEWIREAMEEKLAREKAPVTPTAEKQVV